MRAVLVSLAMFAVSPAGAQQLELGLPADCEIGRTCWVQQYADHDLSAGVTDYSCGNLSYDGHDGTDLRVLDTRSEVSVIAAAPGTVKAVRDGVEDRLMKTEEDRKAVGNRECGNGVVIAHGNGWETQYCHMRKGSIVVKAGDRVEAGAGLGSVGYSGMAAFPHVHLGVRLNGKAVDPFQPANTGTCGVTGSMLWAPGAAAAMDYQAGAILRSGFAAGAVRLEDLETGGGEIAEAGSPEGFWPAMVAYGWAINLEAGDEIIVKLNGPDGYDAEKRQVLDRRKAQFLLFAGLNRPPPEGDYEGIFQVVRKGNLELQSRWTARVW